MFALPKWITDIKKLFGTADGKVLGRVNGAWQFLSSFAPSAHKASHATGGGDALTPADIGATDNSHDHSGGDGAQIDYGSLGNVPSTFTPASHYQDASSINVYTGNFAGNLSAADDTTQKALETIDALVAGGGGGVSIPESVDHPESPEEGDLWIDLSEDPVSYPYLSEGNRVEKKVTPANCSSVTFTGLDSLVDGDYILRGSVAPGGYAGTAVMAMYFNGDTTDSNYKSQYFEGYGTTVSANPYSAPLLSAFEATKGALFEAKISVIGGKVFCNTIHLRDGGSLVNSHYTIIYTGPISSITSILLSANTNAIGTGSTFTLYKSNSAQQLVPYNPVDITSRTSDYPLKPGEVVFIDYVNATSVPLHVATQEGEYELTIIGDTSVSHGAGGDAILQPNNANTDATITGRYSHYLGGGIRTGQVRFVLGYTRLEYTKVKISTITKSKSLISDSIHSDSSNTYWNYNEPSKWANTTTPWTSLGTISFPYAQSGKIIIKRII